MVFPTRPQWIPGGQFLFLTYYGRSPQQSSQGPTPSVPGNISVYRIDCATGKLTAVNGSPFSVGARHPLRAEVDPSGRFLDVLVEDGVLVYAIDAATGRLTPID